MDKKQVRFNKYESIYHYEEVDLKYVLDCIKYARDTSRFQNRINRLNIILEPFLIRKLKEIEINKMSVNKFGQTTLSEKTKSLNLQRGPPGVGFKLTEDGNFDLEHKRLINLNLAPISNNEVVSKQYVDDKLKEFESKIKALITKKINDMGVDIINQLNGNLKYVMRMFEEKQEQKIDTISKTMTEKLSVNVLNETLKSTTVMQSFQDILIQINKIIKPVESNAYKDFKYFYVIIKNLDNYMHRLVETQNQNANDQLYGEIERYNKFLDHLNKHFKKINLEKIPDFETVYSEVKLPQHLQLDPNVNLNTINSNSSLPVQN